MFFKVNGFVIGPCEYSEFCYNFTTLAPNFLDLELLALDMVRGLVQRGVVPFQWVTCDEHFGENPAFLNGISALGKWYLAEVPCNTRVWLRTPRVEPPGPGLLGRPRTRPRLAKNAPRARELRDIAANLPKSAWTRYTFKAGSKGSMVAKFAFLRVTTVRDKLPGPRAWAVFRRGLEPQPELKFYLSNAPLTCAHYELAQLSGLRWPVETTLEEGKGEVGMDHYETRTWLGWHHHMAQTFLAHLFLMHLRLVFKKTPALTTAQAHQLVADVIREELQHLSDILAIIAYRQQRNYAAYRSHRKRTLRRYKRHSVTRKP